MLLSFLKGFVAKFNIFCLFTASWHKALCTWKILKGTCYVQSKDDSFEHDKVNILKCSITKLYTKYLRKAFQRLWLWFQSVSRAASTIFTLLRIHKKNVPFHKSFFKILESNLTLIFRFSQSLGGQMLYRFPDFETMGKCDPKFLPKRKILKYPHRFFKFLTKKLFVFFYFEKCVRKTYIFSMVETLIKWQKCHHFNRITVEYFFHQQSFKKRSKCFTFW